MRQTYVRAVQAVLAGCLVIFIGDFLLGVQIEIFRGIATFSFPWTLDVFVVPFIAGLVVALIYKGRSGKWLAFLPPIIVRCLNCYYLYLTNDQWNENFFFHLHLHYWGLAVILCFQASYLGGHLGGFLSGSYLHNNEKAKKTVGNELDKNKVNTESHSQIGEKS